MKTSFSKSQWKGKHHLIWNKNEYLGRKLGMRYPMKIAIRVPEMAIRIYPRICGSSRSGLGTLLLKLQLTWLCTGTDILIYKSCLVPKIMKHNLCQFLQSKKVGLCYLNLTPPIKYLINYVMTSQVHVSSQRSGNENLLLDSASKEINTKSKWYWKSMAGTSIPSSVLDFINMTK